MSNAVCPITAGRYPVNTFVCADFPHFALFSPHRQNRSFEVSGIIVVVPGIRSLPPPLLHILLISPPDLNLPICPLLARKREKILSILLQAADVPVEQHFLQPGV